MPTTDIPKRPPPRDDRLACRVDDRGDKIVTSVLEETENNPWL